MNYVFIESDPMGPLFTVGFYRPDGTWEPESDWVDREEAAKRAAMLNGGTQSEVDKKLDRIIEILEAAFPASRKETLVEKFERRNHETTD